MLAPDGRCKTLDVAADGYVRSEACAALLLRVLGDCDGSDAGPAVMLRGCAVNQDGRSSSLTAPSGTSQQVLCSGLHSRYWICFLKDALASLCA